MEQFFKQHIEQSLAAIALLFLVIVAAYYIWGITTISLEVSQVTDLASENATTTVFNLDAAKSLNFKGLMQQ